MSRSILGIDLREYLVGDDLEHLEVVVQLMVQEDALDARLRVLAEAGGRSLARPDDAVALDLGPIVLERSGVRIDPVCAMEVSAAEPSPHVERDGRTVWFCSEACRERFEADVPAS